MSLKYSPGWVLERREAVAGLTDELVRWALVREKVLVKLDVKAALAARALVNEILRVADELPSPDHVHEGLALTLLDAKLARLEESARALMSNDTERPPSSPAAPRTAIRLRRGSENSMQRVTAGPPKVGEGGGDSNR